MNTVVLYHTALVTHIIAISMIAGTTLVDYVVYKQFWVKLATDKFKGKAIMEVFFKLPLLFGVGFILIIISGVYMMYATSGAFGEQTWFRIKFALIILIIINGLAFGRRQAVKLRKILAEEMIDKSADGMLLQIKNNLRLFHTSQLAMLITIFVLSVFKFN